MTFASCTSDAPIACPRASLDWECVVMLLVGVRMVASRGIALRREGAGCDSYMYSDRVYKCCLDFDAVTVFDLFVMRFGS